MPLTMRFPFIFTVFLPWPYSTLMLPLFPSFSPLLALLITTMAGGGDASHTKNIPSEQAYDIGRTPIVLPQQVRKLTQDVTQVRKSAQRNPYRKGYDIHPTGIEYSSSHEDFDVKKGRPRQRRHPRDDHKDLKVEMLEFNGNLDPKSYLDWVQGIERILKLKDYYYGKAFKWAILKLKEYALVCYEHLKKSRARKAKSKTKTSYRLKKCMDKRFIPPSYKEKLSSRSALSTKRM